VSIKGSDYTLPVESCKAQKNPAPLGEGIIAIGLRTPARVSGGAGNPATILSLVGIGITGQGILANPDWGKG
jgi:hypothetical protein